jgi:hypothetical protein
MALDENVEGFKIVATLTGFILGMSMLAYDSFTGDIGFIRNNRSPAIARGLDPLKSPSEWYGKQYDPVERVIEHPRPAISYVDSTGTDTYYFTSWIARDRALKCLREYPVYRRLAKLREMDCQNDRLLSDQEVRSYSGD